MPTAAAIAAAKRPQTLILDYVRSLLEHQFSPNQIKLLLHRTIEQLKKLSNLASFSEMLERVPKNL